MKWHTKPSPTAFYIYLRLTGDLIYVMPNSQNRMVNHHPWSGISHDLANLLSHIGFITMNGAFGAGGFFGLEGALVNPEHSIVQQGFTFFA